MIKSENTKLTLSKLPILYDVKCEIGNNHKILMTKRYYYHFTDTNLNFKICNVCMNSVAKFSDKIIIQIGKKIL